MPEASKLRPRRDPDPAPVDLTKRDDETPDGGTPGAATAGDGTADASPEAVEEASAAEGAPVDASEDVDELADGEDRAYRRELRKGLLFGLGGGVLVGLIVSLVLGALVWPGWFVGPGDPDGVATSAISALSARDVNALNAVTCTGPDGNLTSQIPADALQEVAGAVSDGPVTRTTDTGASAPMNLTLSAQGQTQTLPSTLILQVNDGSWCLEGLAQRSQ